jgi:hypothetical protein
MAEMWLLMPKNGQLTDGIRVVRSLNSLLAILPFRPQSAWENYGYTQLFIREAPQRVGKEGQERGKAKAQTRGSCRSEGRWRIPAAGGYSA